MSRRVLFVGAGGKLAKALANSIPADTIGIGRLHAELDISNPVDVAAAIDTVRPDLVINGAAYNLVDRAEAEGMEDCVRVNVLGVGRLAEACRKGGIPLVHFSTDLVFGEIEISMPHLETDPTGPISVYGATKLAGENIVLAASASNYVIRVCRLFGPSVDDRPVGNFPRLMLNLARERGRVRVVNDQIGSPAYTVDVAAAVWQLLDHAPGGLYHLCNGGEVSYADYAREVFKIACIGCDIDAVSTAAYGAAARRPLYTTLDCSKAYAAGVTPLRHWRDALAEYLSTDYDRLQ